MKKIAKAVLCLSTMTFAPLCFANEGIKQLNGIADVVRASDNSSFLVTTEENGGIVGKDAFENTNRYRIPSATMIPGGEKKGRIVVVSDARFGSRCDLPSKASTWARTSDDNGKTWNDINVVSHFDDTDMTNASIGSFYYSVSTGDSSVGSDSKGNVYSLSSFVPPMVGNFFGAKADNIPGSPYVYIDGQCFLRLRKNTEQYDTEKWDNVNFKANSYFTKVTSETNIGSSLVYEYAAPVTGGRLRELKNNNTPTPVLGDEINVWIDQYYYLYSDAQMTQNITAPKLIANVSSTNPDGWGTNPDNQEVTLSEEKVHQHLFMAMSPYQVWRGGVFIGMTKSSNSADSWEKTRDITYMANTYIASNTSNEDLPNYKTRRYICPSKGFEIQNGKDKGKVVFAIYGLADAVNGTAYEEASIFWTEDEGKTWTAGKDYVGGTSTEASKGESSVIEAPDGDLILISRNYRNLSSGISENTQYPTYAVSEDLGNSWSEKGYVFTGKKNHNNPLFSVGNLISAVNLRLTTDMNHKPLVAFSTDNGNSKNGDGDYWRTNGALWIASIVEDSNGSWKFDFTCSREDGVYMGRSYYDTEDIKAFQYSSIVETMDGNIFSAYEGDKWKTENGWFGGPVIEYATFILN